MRIRDYCDPWLIGIAILMVALAVLVAACVPPKSPQHPHPVRSTVVRFVKCMVAPPPVEAIDWPDEDRLGNVLMHRSTKERFKEAYAALVRYAWTQFYKCLAAEREAQGIGTSPSVPSTHTTVEVEVEP